MRSIIKGKKYDTETAKCVAECRSNVGWSDFSHYEERLYRKRTGEFFLHGQGGPSSEYAKRDGLGGWTGGDDIIPLTEDKAREWAEKHMSSDAYERVFGAANE